MPETKGYGTCRMIGVEANMSVGEGCDIRQEGKSRRTFREVWLWSTEEFEVGIGEHVAVRGGWEKCTATVAKPQTRPTEGRQVDDIE